MNNNIEKLKEYLSNELAKTYKEINEVKSRLHTNTTAVNQLHSELMFRKVWLQAQIDNIYFKQS